MKTKAALTFSVKAAFFCPMSFLLNPRLKADTAAVTELALSSVRLMRDGRFLWLVLIPRKTGVSEIFDLSPSDQQILMKEISITARLLKAYAQCDKINIAAFGNMVPQLHIHVIARFTADPAWPGSAIGHGAPMPREPSIEAQIIKQLKQAFGEKTEAQKSKKPMN